MNIIERLHLRGSLFATALIIIVTVLAPSVIAQGGNTGNGGGTVFFINGGGGGYSTNFVWTMGPDGSNVAQQMPWGYMNSPSRALHGGRRWYVTNLRIAGAYYGDGVTERYEMFAIREDFHPTLNNNSETRVQLTYDSTLQPAFGWWQNTHWLPGDESISFRARQWEGAAPIGGGVYTAQIAFGLDGNVVGLASPPSLALEFPLDANGWPAFGSHSWDNTGTKLAYTDSPVTGLWIANLATGTRTRIYTGSLSYPDWSPDGTKIAFAAGCIFTIKPNGTQLRQAIRPATINGTYWSAFAHPYFNSTGTHIVCTGVTSTNGGANAANDVLRATSTGGSLTNLTRTTTINESPIAWR